MSSIRITITELDSAQGPVPVISVSGFVPPCAEGNASIDSLRPQLESIAGQYRDRPIILDFLEVEYSFGDHFGSLWILPMAKHNCKPTIVAEGATADALKSLIAISIPVTIFPTLIEALSQIESNL